MLRLKIYVGNPNTELQYSRMICKREGRKDSKGKKISLLKYTSRLTSLLSWEFFHYLLKCKRTADMQTSQNTGKHARGEVRGRCSDTTKLEYWIRIIKKGVWRFEINCMLEENELSCHSAMLLTTKLWIQDNYFYNGFLQKNKKQKTWQIQILKSHLVYFVRKKKKKRTSLLYQIFLNSIEAESSHRRSARNIFLPPPIW